MLTDYQYRVMRDEYFINKPGNAGGQTKTHSLEYAQDFCHRAKLSNSSAAIIEDTRNSVFYIESLDTLSMIRPFEIQHKIGGRVKKTA